MTTPRIAVVTGGLGGLGRAICHALLAAGHRPIAADRAAATSGIEDGVIAEVLDVSDFAACQAFAQKIEAEHGAIDILVNNAGITRDATLRKMAPEQWQAVIDVNLGSAYNLCHAAVEGMIARGHGRIVNISSVSGQTGNYGQTNYAAAKAGLHGFTMSLARETAGRGITVNSVSSGYIATPMTAAMPGHVREKIVATIPAGRMGAPEDIARAVAFLAADEAGYITGANLPVNGGMFMAF